jgi:ketol-acid reductoisomerase
MKDGNLGDLRGKTIAIVGYGSQGHAQAQNLRESGVKVIVSEVKNTPNYRLALKHGFKPLPASEAAKQADIIQILIPDEIQSRVYEKEIAPQLKKGKALVFSHGFNIHYKYIKPPKEVDVYMVAPKGPGHLVRSEFEKGGGVPCLIAVYQNPSRKAKKLALAHAKGVGGLKAGSFQTTFKDETETDLFGEQVVLCGGLTALIKAGFETLVKAGYDETMAYFECMHEVKLIVDLMYQGGMTYMRHSISNTAEYGDLTRGDRIINQRTRQEMKKILKDVQSGSFAREWVNEVRRGGRKFKALEAAGKKHPIEVVGRKLRKNMKWIDAK